LKETEFREQKLNNNKELKCKEPTYLNISKYLKNRSLAATLDYIIVQPIAQPTKFTIQN
jgi:hypothetical protein